MVDVLVDMHLAEATTDNRATNGAQINMAMAEKYDTLFVKHKITLGQFKTSYDYYLDHPDELSEIYTEVVNKLTTTESRVSGGKKLKPPPISRRDSSR